MNFDSPAQMVSSDDLNIREAATKAPQWKHRGLLCLSKLKGCNERKRYKA